VDIRKAQIVGEEKVSAAFREGDELIFATPLLLAGLCLDPGMGVGEMSLNLTSSQLAQTFSRRMNGK
jgi:hypothetical protein